MMLLKNIGEDVLSALLDKNSITNARIKRFPDADRREELDIFKATHNRLLKKAHELVVLMPSDAVEEKMAAIDLGIH